MKGLLRTMLKTDATAAPLIARLALGLVILPHGLQKTFGWFGGYGFQGTVGFFTETMGVPLIVAVLVIAAESLGALALVLGFLTRFCAASIAVVMLGAILMVHVEHGFFMNWFGQQAGEGLEYHLLVIGLALSLVASGGGRLSLDRKIADVR